MKKTIGIILILLFNGCVAFGQINFDLNNLSDCGTVKETIIYSEWENVDTLSKVKIIDTVRDWVYNPKLEPFESNSYDYAVYCPCGCLWDKSWREYRICKLTGIKQRRIKTLHQWRVPPPPPPKTEYETVIDSLSKK